jgi:hypothetical protein
MWKWILMLCFLFAVIYDHPKLGPNNYIVEIYNDDGVIFWSASLRDLCSSPEKYNSVVSTPFLLLHIFI